MTDQTSKTELLLREYAEAGQITRQHEQLTRTSVSILSPTLIALAGYIVGSQGSNATKVVLALAGIMVSFLSLNIVRRHQLYYRCYIGRARAIEESLKVQDEQVIQLYTLGKNATKGSFTISNKSAFSVFFVILAVFFILAAVVYACPLTCRIGP